MPADHVGPPADPAIGPLLLRLRLARGWSQLRVAEQLCAASGVPTVTRHEVSRWERGDRVPGDFWLGWLALVLEVPASLLAAAAAGSRARQPGAAGGYPGRPGLERLAQAWFAEPAGPPAGDRGDVQRFAGELLALAGLLAARPAPGDAASRWNRPAPDRDETPDRPAAVLARLRRLDDLVGGTDLAPVAGRQLAAAAHRAAAAGGRPADRLATVAQGAQFAGWVAADAGDLSTALRGYGLAVRASVAAGDRPFGGYALGCASQLLAEAGRPDSALLLARTAYAGARHTSSATGRAVLLHRVAQAAAACGRRGLAERALESARAAAAGRAPERDPAWLYWAGEHRLLLLAGRCLVAVGRPRRAAPALRDAVAAAAGPRESALAGTALARAYLLLGEVESAGESARRAVLDTVRSGSVRAEAGLAGVADRLGRFGDVPAARRYRELAGVARPYLPGSTGLAAARAGQH